MTQKTYDNSEVSPTTVVFDLGGVLARISHSWEEAARHAGISLERPSDAVTPFVELPEFDQYQGGEIDEDTYLSAIAAWGGCSVEDARKIHNHILVEPFAGTEEIVAELNSRGVATGCLSNTNAPHWQELAISGRFPAIVALEKKMASHLVGMNKPDPRIFLHYAETYGLRPEEVVYFEDGELNVIAAQGVGFRTQRIDPNQETAPQIRAFLEEQGLL